MTFAAELVGAHVSSATARHINGEVNSSFSCAGSTVTDATAISQAASNIVITTCSSGQGAILPACSIRDECNIYNATTNAATIYPDTGAAINQLSANIGMLLAPYTGVKLRKVTTTQWIGWLSA